MDQSARMAPLEPTPAVGAWLTEHVARYCEKTASEIDPAISLADYGMDSYYAVTLTGDIEDKFGLVVDPAVIWENPTIDALAAAIVEATRGNRTR